MAEQIKRVRLSDAAVSLRTTPAALYNRCVREGIDMQRDDKNKWTVPETAVKKLSAGTKREQA